MNNRRIYIFLILILLPLIALGRNTGDAQKELAKQKIEYSADGFIERVLSADYHAIDLFLKAGMDINTTDSMDRTALMRVAQNGEIEVAQYSIKKGADINLQDVEGQH